MTNLETLTRSQFLQYGAGTVAAGVALVTHLQPAEAKSTKIVMPVFTQNANILFQGDSITDGNRGRSADPNHILGHGYVFIIAAHFGANYPERNLTFINRGISGNKVTDLAARWQHDTLDLKPDVLSILIGVNDSSHAMSTPDRDADAQEYEKTYDQILQDTLTTLPNVKLVICESFTLPVGNKKTNYDEWRAVVKQHQDIAAKLAVKYHAPLVGFQKVFDDACKRAPAEHWIWDGVHPTYSGHQLMADEWVKTVDAFYK